MATHAFVGIPTVLFFVLAVLVLTSRSQVTRPPTQREFWSALVIVAVIGPAIVLAQIFLPASAWHVLKRVAPHPAFVVDLIGLAWLTS